MPHALSTSIRPFVTLRSRTRGEAYLRQGRVTIVHSGPTSVSARVRGSVPYEVSLTIANGLLRVRCTCPFFEGSAEPCKHIWAVVLRADSGRLLDVPSDLVLDVGDDALDAASAAAPSPHDRMEAPARRVPPRRVSPVRRRTAWEAFLSGVTPPASPAPGGLQLGELVYVFDPVRSTTMQGMLVELLRRVPTKRGGWTRPRSVSLTRGQVADLPDVLDRQILERVSGAQHAYGGNWDGLGATFPVPSAFVLTPALQRDLVPLLCATGRLLLRWPPTEAPDDTFTPIDWDPHAGTFRLQVTGDRQTGYTVTGAITHDGQLRPLSDAMFVTGSVVLWRPPTPDDRPRLGPFDTAGAERWLAGIVGLGSVTVPVAGSARLVEALATSGIEAIDCPDELRVETRSAPPTPVVRMRRLPAPPYAAQGRGSLHVTLSFAYGDVEIEGHAAQPVVFDATGRVAWRRDVHAEHAAQSRLGALGVHDVADWAAGGRRLELAETALPALVRELVPQGWRIEAEGRLYRRPGTSSLGLRSGIDWFELHGSIDFEGVEAHLPALVGAARRGESFVTLDDGSVGLLPDEWLARHARLAGMGQAEGDHVRFTMSQAALLDAWLAQQPEATWDETFARHREDLMAFEGVSPLQAPPSFHGELRDYQRDALGWFAFLRRFGFGGCLADEMGLGKTVMVLAALEGRRVERVQSGERCVPSLIVVPRSLVFNWMQEAQRFAPQLRVLDATGSRRRGDLDRLQDHDVVITTYGTLRRDIGHLKSCTFDYAILDEAQAIKNAGTASAKAARLLRASHRLALSGTPVENHLGELWSLFEFLNPGLLGSSTAFAASGAAGRTPDDEMLALLARGLRPFILRRTKEQVAAELPPRTEQTLYCDLEPAQRRLYDGLRAHYRAGLLGKAGADGNSRSTLQVLEALLRLRQAACHPGLIDATHADGPSAKLDLLVPRLQELVEDGRKVLVFSQFTSLLALLRTRLDAAGLTYEYLDGRTRDRAVRVRRFQEEACPLFLISLKAGGLGLNLTAADYVFLLDPWWNPAVEAQAIDRAHRIGQTRSVFAYRLIARNTVEEKVLELQQSKRHLADAVVRADASVLRNLRREDLELLLS